MQLPWPRILVKLCFTAEFYASGVTGFLKKPGVLSAVAVKKRDRQQYSALSIVGVIEDKDLKPLLSLFSHFYRHWPCRWFSQQAFLPFLLQRPFSLQGFLLHLHC